MKTPCYLAFALLLQAYPASASCSDDVDAFAAKYHIDASIPNVDAPNTGSTSKKLQASGGVIAPPTTGDMPTVTPPLRNTDSMMTAPAIPPQVAGGDAAGSKVIANADTASHEVMPLVQAARAAAKQGHEIDCQQRLADAMRIVAPSAK